MEPGTCGDTRAVCSVSAAGRLSMTSIASTIRKLVRGVEVGGMTHPPDARSDERVNYSIAALQEKALFSGRSAG